jgi:hypothetical protein
MVRLVDVRRKGMWPAIAAAVVALLATPSIAAADTRYAEPGGNGPAGDNGCQMADPCGVEAAIENAAVVDGDRILLLAGVYNIGAASLLAVDSITIEPAPGAGRPIIASSGSPAALLFGPAANAAVVRGLEISKAGNGAGLYLQTGTAERMVVSSVQDLACQLEDALIRDSTCLLQGSFGIAALGGRVAGSSVVMRARNVTAISKVAGGPAILVTGDFGGEPKLSAHNVIASGSPDAIAQDLDDPSDSSAEIVFSNSSFDTTNSNGEDNFVTPPGTGPGNITAPAQFVNFAADDFHQAAGSPTIDRGSPDPLLGALDLDGLARTQGAASDMGAYEFAPPPVNPGATKKPKKCKRKKAKKKTTKASAAAKKKTKKACKRPKKKGKKRG